MFKQAESDQSNASSLSTGRTNCVYKYLLW